MNISFENFHWVEFNQERITTDLKQRIDLFEFSSLYPKEEHQFYCQFLMKKLLSLNRMLLSRFLHYHCNTSKNPSHWLTSLEKLLEKNIDELMRLGFTMHLNQIFIYSDKLQQLYSSTINNEVNSEKKNNLEIEKIKSYSKNLNSFNEKKAYLLRKKTDYLQHSVGSKIEPSLDKQIDLELDYLKTELMLLKDSNKGLENKNDPIIWNGQVQQLVELFLQCLQQTNKKGEPLLQVSNEKVIQFIIRNFKKKDGSEFSASSIRSMLKPSWRKKK